MTNQLGATASKLAVFGEFAPDGRAAYDNAVTRFRDNKILLPLAQACFSNAVNCCCCRNKFVHTISLCSDLANVQQHICGSSLCCEFCFD